MSEDVQLTKGAFVNEIILTGKSLSEAFIFASINPQYDNRLFMELPVQYMETTSAEHVFAMFCACSFHVLNW